MKRSRLTWGLSLAALVLFFVASPVARARAETAWQVLFNGDLSKTKIVVTDAGPMIPVYIPIPPEGESQSYGVLIETDSASKQIKITKVKKKGPRTERGDCPKCSGSKACQSCYPAGSGMNTAGYECYSCNATGACPYCQGSGVCYTCGGAGAPNGCFTCGDVSK